MINYLEEFNNSLKLIFEDTIDNGEIQAGKNKSIFLDLEMNDFWEFLKKQWSYLDSNALNCSEAFRNFNNKKKHWKLVLKDSEELSIKDFILKHSDSKVWISNLLRDNKLTKEQIDYEKKLVLLDVPKFLPQELESRFIEWEGCKIYSFQIYDVFPLRVNLHIRLKKTRFYSFLIFFTFTINNPDKHGELSMKLINEYYQSLIISYEILNLLKSFKFREVDKHYAHKIISSSNFETFKQQKYYPPSTQDIIQTIPFTFQCYYINLLNNSEQEMFTILSEILKDVYKTVQKYENVKEPGTYYEKFQEDLKYFLKKGKELFYKAESLIYESTEKPGKLIERKRKKPKITIDSLLKLFQKETSKDFQNQVNFEDMGYRSIPEIYSIYKDIVRISWATFNKQVIEIIINNSKFEDRERQKKGGGKEYRINPKLEEHPKGIKNTNYTEIFKLDQVVNEKEYENLLNYEQAVIYEYDYQDHKASLLYEKIFNSYPEKLENFSWLFYATVLRLGYIYLNYGDLNKAKFYFGKGKENSHLLKVDYSIFNIELLKIKRLEGKFNKLNSEINRLEGDFKQVYNKNLDLLNENYDFYEGKEIQDLDVHYIRGLKQDPKFKNNSIFKEIITIDMNLLNLNLLKLDLLRKKIFIQTTRNPLVLTKNDGKKQEIIIPEDIQQDLNEASKIIDKVFRNGFNWGDNNFHLFGLYKTYFEYVVSINKKPYDLGFDYGIPITFFPTYYTKFLFDIVNFDWQYQIFEPLNKSEFLCLDNDSKAEYLVKFCEFKFKIPDLGIGGEKFIPILKNLRTLIQFAIKIIEEYRIDYLLKKANDIQAEIEKEIENFISTYEKMRERRRKR